MTETIKLIYLEMSSEDNVCLGLYLWITVIQKRIQ